MDFILEQLEQGRERYQGDKYMATACNSGWAKLDKYYSKTSDSPAYAAVVVLHPPNKWQEIENSWCPEWIPLAKSMVKQYIEAYGRMYIRLVLCRYPIHILSSL